jgi:hypothetical protein
MSQAQAQLNERPGALQGKKTIWVVFQLREDDTFNEGERVLKTFATRKKWTISRLQVGRS